MSDFQIRSNELTERGFTTIPGIYTENETQQLISLIDETDTSKDTFRKTADLFAIRQFLEEIPEAGGIIFNERLRSVIRELLGDDYFVAKSIYFDKPANSNWYVSYHQDLTISVDKKMELDGFGPWTVKQHQFTSLRSVRPLRLVAVQPPLEILQNIFTIRIHLDAADGENGALKVIPGSHAKGIYRPETIDWQTESEVICEVPKGGIMIMKPLLLHSSGRTTNKKKRRVIHIEFSNVELPPGLLWAERQELNKIL